MTPNINHKYTKVGEGDRIDATILKMTTEQEIDHLVETETLHTEVEEILVEIIDRIIKEDQEIILGMITGETIIEMTIGKMITEDNDVEIEVMVEIDAGVATEIIQEKTMCDTKILVKIGIE